MAEPVAPAGRPGPGRALPDRDSASARSRFSAALEMLALLLPRLAARLAGAVFVLWMVATITFFAVRLIPGDPAQAVLGGPGSQASPEALAAVSAEYGFDQPVIVQYFAQLGRLMTGDLGRSYALNMDVGPLVLSQLGGTLLLAVPLAGFLGQIMRESLLVALESPFVLSARARGESERGVRWVHALRHASLPAISLSGWAFGSLISGAVVVETIFARPGLGRTLLNAVTLRDVPVVIGVVMIVAVVYILMTLLMDAASRLVDPRLRLT